MRFDPADMDIVLQGIEVCRRGLAADFEEAALQRKLNESEIDIGIVLNGRGREQACFFTCDLTEGYVVENSAYST